MITANYPERLLPLTPETLLDPLGILEAEHAYQLQVCDWTSGFVDDLGVDPAPGPAIALLAFLNQDLARHCEDEERDLFPRLSKRCRPEDGIDAVLAQLSREHDLDRDLVDFMLPDLGAIAAGRKVPNLLRFFSNVSGFIETQRRHIAWENRMVLPLARQRLEAPDLREIAEGMAARRGLTLP